MFHLFIALMPYLPLAQSAMATTPTFTLHCETKPGADLQAKIDLNATRQPDFSSAKAEITSLDLVKKDEWTLTSTQAFEMTGQIEDGRSHLLIKLDSDSAPGSGNLPSLVGLLLDLSYEYSVSHLVMSDGSDFLLQCKVLP